MAQKPIILEIEEAKIELVQAINNIIIKHNIPCYFIEPVLEELHSQVKAAVQVELEQARALVTENNKQEKEEI